MTVIYRAMCYSTHERVPVAEQIVYINGGTRGEVRERLQSILAILWNVPADTIDYYNLAEEGELMEQSTGKPIDGDARLLEVGWSGTRASYPDTPPLFLLRPKDNARMLAAWHSVQPRPDEHDATRWRTLEAQLDGGYAFIGIERLGGDSFDGRRIASADDAQEWADEAEAS